MTESEQWLDEYVEGRSEEAFGRLVRKHLNLVYSTALRIGNNDTHFAEDVAQIVFSDLALKAPRLGKILVAGWLYRHTRFIASKSIRTLRRREARENQIMSEQANVTRTDESVSELRGVLDDALGRLSNEDRDAIVLRFFEKLDFQAVAGSLGIKEDAAQKRVSRAVEKLRAIVGRQGVTVSAGSLVLLLQSESIAAPVSLGTTIAAKALAAAIPTMPLKLLTLLSSTKMKTAIVAGLILSTTTPFFWARYQNGQLTKEKLKLQQQIEALEMENREREKHQLAELERLGNENKEIYRLRGEVTLLRQQARQTNAPVLAARSAPEESAIAAKRQIVIESKFVDISPDAFERIPQLSAIGKANVSEFYMVISEEETQKLIESFRETEGVDLVSAPKITTLNGRQSRISVTETMKAGEENIEIGPSLDVTPFLSTTGGACAVTIDASCKEFLGWADVGDQQIPRFRIRSANRNANIPAGQSLLLGLAQKSGSAKSTEDKRMVVLVTPTEIDAAGNRVVAQ